jgi:hypothetical protein
MKLILITMFKNIKVFANVRCCNESRAIKYILNNQINIQILNF